MKNLLILIVAAALYLHFYPNAEVTQFYNEQKQNLLKNFAEFSDTSVRLKSEKIYLDLENDLERFSDKEVEHLKSISSSRDNVKDFYYTICKTEKRDIVFHLKNEQKVCSTIARYVSKF